MNMKMCNCRHKRIANITCINLIKTTLVFDNAKQISTIHVLQDNAIALWLAVGIMDGCKLGMYREVKEGNWLSSHWVDE